MIHPDFPRVKAPSSPRRVLAASSPWSLHVLAVSSPWSLLGLGAPGWAQLIPLTPAEVPSSTPFQRGSTGMLLPHPKRGRGCSAPIPERSHAPVVFQWDDSNHLLPKYSHSPPGLGLGWLHTLHPTLSLHVPKCPFLFVFHQVLGNPVLASVGAWEGLWGDQGCTGGLWGALGWSGMGSRELRWGSGDSGIAPGWGWAMPGGLQG